MSNIFISIFTLRTLDASNLNRDDAGAPKSAILGGVTRARFSSQSKKRPLRLALHEKNSALYGGLRTKQLAAPVQQALEAEGCPNAEELANEVQVIFVGGKKAASDKAPKKGKNAGASEGKEVTDEESDQWPESGTTIGFFTRKEIGVIVQQIKQDGWKVSEKSIKKMIKEASVRDKVDVALMGRMFASSPELDVEAALSMSPSLSTHEVTSEVDFFTAVDDAEGSRGSAHMGTKEFCSGVMADTTVLNLGVLKKNLHGISDDDLRQIIIDVVEGILLHAVPEGNSHGMLSNTLPQYAKVLIGPGCPCAASYETPVKADTEGGYLANSLEAMDKEIARIASFQEAKALITLVNEKGLVKGSVQEVVTYV